MALLNQTPQDYYNGDQHGQYQFVSLHDIINQFMLIYVGEDKIIPKAKRIDVAFHAQRALAELSFDTLKSFKTQEITVPPSLQMTLPQDYVNYTNVLAVDSLGIKHPIYPTEHTQNPQVIGVQQSDGDYKLEAIGTLDSALSRIVLTKEHTNILVGMKVLHPYIPTNAANITVVTATSTVSNITTIDIGTLNNNGTISSDILPTQNVTETSIAFENIDGSLVKPTINHIVTTTATNLFIGGTGNAVTGLIQGASGVFGDIKPGMFVSDANFTVGTKVLEVTDTEVIVDSEPISGTVAQSATSFTQVNFVDYDVDSETWSRYKSGTIDENKTDYISVDNDIINTNQGQRYGLDPTTAQSNGSYYIDEVSGLIHFSSNLSGSIVVLDYISDGLGTEEEMRVHKFAEEAMYKRIAYSVASGRLNIPEYIIQRLKKERFATTRTAKLRLSNLKIEELTQILRGKSKWIKH